MHVHVLLSMLPLWTPWRLVGFEAVCPGIRPHVGFSQKRGWLHIQTLMPPLAITDLSQSFYVGDMAGRVGDIQGTNNPTPSDTDK